MSNKTATTIYLPLEQPERAARIKVDELLPKRIYEKLTEAISNALNQLPCSGLDQSFDELRVHNAVLLDGARGAGKTTVLVNLQQYLHEANQAAASKVHILKPVDPTLLEDGESLFLNVVVAAVLSDQKVKKERERSDYAVDTLNRAVLRLGEALENRQTLQREIGLDRLRAFVGSQELTQRVHEFFDATLKLIGAKLLVLPIDDVDTSLGRAFENLEVVRRYLGTPLVLAVVCGDVDLYADLVWRDFYQRMQPGSCGSETAQGIELLGLAPAVNKTKELSQEYLRKLFPAQLRCKMPGLGSYLENPDIVLRNAPNADQKPPLSLPLFHAWLSALLKGPVNGIENSGKLTVPLSSVRSLFQLLSAVKEQMPALHEALESSGVLGDGNAQKQNLALRRALQMPGIPTAAMQAFEEAIRKETGRQRSANSVFTKLPTGSDQTAPDILNAQVGNWIPQLLQHWSHDADAGPACLVLQAQQHWLAGRKDSQQAISVLDTPLFRPQLQQGVNFRGFNGRVELDWQERLKDKYPDKALSQLPKTALLPFAIPELGRAVPKKDKYFVPKSWFENESDKGTTTEQPNDTPAVWSCPLHCQANFLTDLMLQHGFYSTSNQTRLVNVGRLLELIAMSLVTDVTADDIHALLARAPFHSMTDLAPTKPVVDGVEDSSHIQSGSADENDVEEQAEAISALVAELKQWRDRHAAALVSMPTGSASVSAVDKTSSAQCRVSPWLIYCVLNKVLNQAEYFNRTHKNGVSLAPATPSDVWQVARITFNAFWAALGSFEKGPLFGLPAVVSISNISSDGKFEQNNLYRQNIAPFASDEAEVFGKQTRSLTAALRDHPLRGLLNELATVKAASVVNPQPVSASTWLSEKLGREVTLKTWASTLSTLLIQKTKNECEDLIKSFREQYPNEDDWMNKLGRAFKGAHTSSPSSS